MSRPSVREGQPEKYWQPKKWTARHETIVRLHSTGLTNNQIARIVGMDPARVSVILSDPRAKPATHEQLSKNGDTLAEVFSRIQAHAGDALDEVLAQMSSAGDVRVRQKAAFGIMDRAGLAPVQKRVMLGAQLPPEMLQGVMSALVASEEGEDYEYDVPERREVSDAEFTIVEEEESEPEAPFAEETSDVSSN